MKRGNSTSIRATLKNLAEKENIDFQNVVIIRFLHERLLYRLSVSEYADKFFLKGGSLMYALEGIHFRPTMDIDLLAKTINNDKEHIKVVFQKICSLDYEDDSVYFDTKNIIVSDIREEDKYSGVRVLIDVAFDTIKQRLQIDLGFSDRIIPAPILLEYPVLMEALDKPHLKAYSIETVIAEKFHAMIVLGNFNSRMKDFYDVYFLLKNNKIEETILQKAIQATFQNRDTPHIESPELFSETFYKNGNRQTMWKAFLKKIKAENLDFENVVKYITNKLSAVYNKLK